MLGAILRDTRERIARIRASAIELEARAREAPTPASFTGALRSNRVAVIAEVKRRSPSKGAIKPGLSVAEQVAAYELGGAAAISILTEPMHFGGSGQDLEDAGRCTRKPLLRKDFVIDPLQIVEARALGAAAVLLIARALPQTLLAELAAAADEHGIEVLIEVRTIGELNRALGIDGAVIGVNNRDLETLAIDTGVASSLIPLIPAGRIAVAESGMASVGDVQRAADSGADAVLVGSAVSAASDPTRAVADLAGVPRRPRDRRP